LARGLAEFRGQAPGLEEADPNLAAEYLFYELIDPVSMVVSPRAAEALKRFQHALTTKRLDKTFLSLLVELDEDPVAQFEVARDWIGGALDTEDRSNRVGSETEPSSIVAEPWRLEAAVHLIRDEFDLMAVKHVETEAMIEGMLGDHPLVEGGRYAFDYLAFTSKLRRFLATQVPQFEAYEARKVALIENRRREMRLEEFKAKVMPAFVRNRLLDRVYLPLIGDNLAKQMGTAGADTRTDRMGLLLLISPPGYGKTTLMEYVANRLGLAFMKINGPVLGHEVRSLDPSDAPNAGAREEIHKLNFALEMGDNIMLYVDDIQHTHPEFLQKFISLCDAQRKIEGVWNGESKTYDLRGRKVCVVMAGNPYTESGGKFQIPDMLANRADTYNLGDIAGDHSGDFEASYIENSVTSNPVLSRLASRHPADVHAVMRIVATGQREGVDLEGSHSLEEMEEYESVMAKLSRVRDTILRVNREYIRSAAMEDAYRTEPPFRLQGSYRNMNRIAERILPIMTDGEVETAIFYHYENEAQTLTKGAEANLLKFRELEDVLTEAETERWDEIRRKFARNLLMGGRGDDDPVNRVVGTLAGFSDGLGRIEGVLSKAAAHQAQPATLADVTVEKLEQMIAALRAVPVNVEIKVVPVREGDEEGAAEASSEVEKPTATPAPKRKRLRGKEKGVPVDVETEVDQPTADEA
ncbi:MAG: ATP-binding protein, partial [Verrucomicrobiae bacterium]|nr:ATP-binding protein [Verrucomicrobiae bacterium]